MSGLRTALSRSNSASRQRSKGARGTAMIERARIKRVAGFVAIIVALFAVGDLAAHFAAGFDQRVEPGKEYDVGVIVGAIVGFLLAVANEKFWGAK